MEKMKAVLYPYDIESSYFFRHNDLNENFDVIGAVAPKGWGLNGKDALSIDGSGDIGIKVFDNFQEVNDDVDTVILVESHNKLDFESIIYKKLESLSGCIKNLICLRNLDFESIQKLKELCKRNNIHFKDYNELEVYKEVEYKKLLENNIPIIFVMGISDRTSKFNIQLGLRRELIKMGYKVSQVGTKNHCNIFGFHSFPSFMFSKDISEVNKIATFNRFIKTIEVNEEPDVIVIGIPGGIMPIGKVLTNDFGIIAYLVSNSVKPDAAIFSLLYANYSSDYFEEINKLVRYKFGYNIDCFNLSNTYFDYQESKDSEDKYYTIIDSNFVNGKKSNFKSEKPIYNDLNNDDYENIAQHIVNSLAGEESIIDII